VVIRERAWYNCWILYRRERVMVYKILDKDGKRARFHRYVDMKSKELMGVGMSEMVAWREAHKMYRRHYTDSTIMKDVLRVEEKVLVEKILFMEQMMFLV
jgi:hypothetical protein